MDLKELSEFYDSSTMDFDEFISMYYSPTQNLPTQNIKQEQDAEYLKSEQLDREKLKKLEPNPKTELKEPNPKTELKEPNPKTELPDPPEDQKPTLKELRELRVKHLEK